MARRLFFVSLAIFALSLAYQIGVNRTEAQTGQSHIIAIDHYGWCLDSSGQVWNIGSFGPCWNRVPKNDPPIPVEQIAFWGAHALVATDGTGWHLDVGGWTNCGVVPGGPITVDPSTWGLIKGKYK